AKTVFSAPDDHFTARPHCRLSDPGIGRVSGAGGGPTVGRRIVSPAVIKAAAVDKSAPDDHFTAGPDCGVKVPTSGSVRGAGGCPTVSAGVVPAAGIQKAESRATIATPDDHFTSGPHCRVLLSSNGRIAGACGCPRVRARI